MMYPEIINRYNILEDYDRPVPGEGPFYTDYLNEIQKHREDIGIENVDWKETTYPYLADRREELTELFNSYYGFREIGQETESRFQYFLQLRFDMVADKYNHAYEVMEENIDEMDKIGLGYHYEEKRDRTIDSTGDSNGTRNTDSKYKDTPSATSSTLNNPTNQNIDERTDTNHATTNEVLDDTITRDNDRFDEQRIDYLNRIIDRYKQLDNDFIMEFETCFMGVLQ